MGGDDAEAIQLAKPVWIESRLTMKRVEKISRFIQQKLKDSEVGHVSLSVAADLVEESGLLDDIRNDSAAYLRDYLRKNRIEGGSKDRSGNWQITNTHWDGEVASDERAKDNSIDPKEVGGLIESAKSLAIKYKAITGRPLGITGEVAEFEVANILGLRLASVRSPGYDAIRDLGGAIERIQIKGRSVRSVRRPQGRLPSINLEQEWDVVILALLDRAYEPLQFWEARKEDIAEALSKAELLSG